eukprot:15450798-Alexandrium_andersonii.AAC.1
MATGPHFRPAMWGGAPLIAQDVGHRPTFSAACGGHIPTWQAERGDLLPCGEARRPHTPAWTCPGRHRTSA